MQRIDPTGTGSRRSGWAWGAPVEACLGALEVIASEQPELLEFQAQTLLNSTMGFAVRELGAALEVAPENVGQAVSRACTDLDRLAKHRRTWRDPAEILDSPNLTALLYVCRARLDRTSPPTLRRRLEKVLRRLESAYGLARSRAWIEDFIGPLPQKSPSRDTGR